MAEKEGAGGKPQEFDKENGQYTGAGTTYRQNTSYKDILSKSKKAQSGAVSGAQSGAIDEDKQHERAEEHARKMYETYRHRISDIPKIAKVTGHSEDEIRRVKNHMFFNEYDLDGGKHRFDADFQQVQSWTRLESGNPEEHDLIMIEHELIEERLMREKNLSYDKAHEKANETANYQLALKEYKHGKIKKEGN